MPLGDSSLVTSAPMGDAARSGAGLSAVVLDGYGRAYDVNLGAGIRAAPRALMLTGDTTPGWIEKARSLRWPVLFKPIDLPQLLTTIQPQAAST